ncbi:hypothetical protein SDJN03_00738, partial [Cucurbita argyrosperma subsp. sororia]
MYTMEAPAPRAINRNRVLNNHVSVANKHEASTCNPHSTHPAGDSGHPNTTGARRQNNVAAELSIVEDF